MCHRRHVLLIILLGFLLFTESSNLENLKPALVSENQGAELYHLTVYHVVRRYVSDKLPVARLDIRNHQKVNINPLKNLFKVESTVFD